RKTAQALLSELTGFVRLKSEVLEAHRLRNRINTGARAERTGILINLADFNHAGAVAGITGLTGKTHPLALAIGAHVRVVGSQAAIVDPTAALAFGAGFRRTLRRGIWPSFSGHT